MWGAGVPRTRCRKNAVQFQSGFHPVRGDDEVGGERPAVQGPVFAVLPVFLDVPAELGPPERAGHPQVESGLQVVQPGKLESNIGGGVVAEPFDPGPVQGVPLQHGGPFQRQQPLH
jgi:hypothetical protein